MAKNIEGFKKCPIKNHILHEGLLLLIYEFLTTQTIGKTIGDLGSASEDTTSSDSGDELVVKLEKIDTPRKPIPVTYDPHISSRKSPRCLPPIPPSPHPKEVKEASDDDVESDTYSEEEYLDTGKESEMEEDKGRENDKEVVTPMDPKVNPKKRKVNQALPRDHPSNPADVSPSPTLPKLPQEVPISPLEEMIEIMVEKGGEVIRKNKMRSWRNF